MTQGRYIECLPCVAMLFLRKKSADIDSIYLFFDYDFYRGDLSVKNGQVQELLEYFTLYFGKSGSGNCFVYCMLSTIG